MSNIKFENIGREWEKSNEMLKACLFVLNQLPNRMLPKEFGFGSTYTLAGEIDKFLKEVEE